MEYHVLISVLRWQWNLNFLLIQAITLGIMPYLLEILFTYFEPGTKYLCSMIVMYNYLILCTYTLALMRAKINQCHFWKSRLFVTGRPKYGPTFGAGQKNNQCPGTLDLLDGLDEPMRYLYWIQTNTITNTFFWWLWENEHFLFAL